MTETKLIYICVGSGRDGTQSVNKLLQSIFDAEEVGRTTAHEYGAGEFYQNNCDYMETGDDIYLQAIDKLIETCPCDAIVGNGYAPILNRFASKLNAGTRRDRKKDSLVTFPEWQSG